MVWKRKKPKRTESKMLQQDSNNQNQKKRDDYTTVDPKQFVFFESEHSAACDVQSWETKDCKAEAATAV